MNNTDQQTELEESPVEELTAADGIADPSYILKIQEYLEKQKIDVMQPVFYLYRYENYTSGEAKALICKYKEGDPPDEDDIGRKFGSGRYLLVMSIPRSAGNNKKTQVRAYRFRVHPEYDKLRSESPVMGGNNMPVPYPVIEKNSGSSLVDAIQIIERLITAMVPMFNKPKDESISEVLNQSYGVMGDMMKKSMMNNIALMNDFQKSLVFGGNAEMDETEVLEEEEPSIISQIAPLLTEWIPLILGKGPQATVAQKAVQMTPQFQQIVKNKSELLKLVNYFDQEKGPAETDKILTALKIRRPGRSARPARRRAPVKKTAAGK